MNKAIFWDSDGTLIYGNESFAYSLVKACEEAECSCAKLVDLKNIIVE